jgi:simple sugar transport system permease protein
MAELASVSRSYSGSGGGPAVEALYDIPVIGLLLQFVVYVATEFPVVGPTIMAAAVPIVLGALCGFMNERTGVVNIGIEGMMLLAAFTAWWGASLAAQFIPIRTGPLGITPALLIGLAAGIGAACLLSALHAWLSISLRADQIITA